METFGNIGDSWPEDARNCPPPRPFCLFCMPGLPSQQPTAQPHLQLSLPRAPTPCSCHGHIASLHGMCPTVVWDSFFSVVGGTGGVGSTASKTIR